MKTFLSRQPRQLDPSLFRQLHREGVLDPERPPHRKALILARALLRVRYVSLQDIPAADRLGALENQLRAWQPFPSSCIWVQVFDDHAQAFACDVSQLPEDLPASTQFLPEVALRPSGLDGLRLIQCLQGVEGQCWKGGRLEHSRWWGTPPDEAQWMAFVRASGQPQAAALPPVENLAYQWPAARLQQLEHLSDSRTEGLRLVGGLVAFALIGFAAYVAHEVQQAHEMRTQAERALTTLTQDAAPARAAQAKALRTRQELEAMARSLEAVQPLEVLDHLAKVLQRGVVIKELELQGQELRLLLEAPPELSRSALIEALEAGAWLTGVAEQKDGVNRAWIGLQARLKGLRPPAAVQSAGGVKRSSTDALPGQQQAPSIPPQVQQKGKP